MLNSFGQQCPSSVKWYIPNGIYHLTEEGHCCPKLFQHTIVCLLVLRWKRGRELVHCLYKKLQTCRSIKKIVWVWDSKRLKVKSNVASAIELFGDGRLCVQLCIETLSKRTTSVAYLTNVSFKDFFFMRLSQKMPLYFFYRPRCKNVKMVKTPNLGRGSCLNLNTLPSPLYEIWVSSNANTTSTWCFFPFLTPSIRL